MSFLRRLARRAAAASGSGVLIPKRRSIGRPMARRAMEEPVDEEVQPTRLARQAEEEEEEEVQPTRLSRQAEEEEEEEVQPSRLSRQAEEGEEEEVQPSRLARQAEEEGEEEVQPSRLTRQAEEEEEEIQPSRLSRQAEEEEEEELQTLRAMSLARQAEGEGEEEIQAVRSPTEEEMSPENATVPDETSAEPEPSDLRALRRHATVPGAAAAGYAGLGAAGATAVVEGPSGVDGAEPQTPTGWEAAGESLPPAEIPFSESYATGGERPSAELSFQRPQVVIEQLDVLIHEPQSAPAVGRQTGGISRRALRARYLRGL